MQIEDQYFYGSNGRTRLAGRLFLPEDAVQSGSMPPVVIMSNSLGLDMDCELPRFAEAFCRSGMAVFMFDYRNFGRSDSIRRFDCDVNSQLLDLRAALVHVQGLSTVDTTRITLWGTGLSGGHVLRLASELPDLSCVVAQVPILKGSDLLTFKGFCYGMWDLMQDLFTGKPITIPVFNEKGMAFYTGPSSKRHAGSFLLGHILWANKVNASNFIKLLFYNPASKVEKITAKVLLIGAFKDEYSSSSALRRVSKRISRCNLLELSMGHFDVYFGDEFEAIIERQVNFVHQTALMTST